MEAHKAYTFCQPFVVYNTPIIIHHHTAPFNHDDDDNNDHTAAIAIAPLVVNFNQRMSVKVTVKVSQCM